MTSKMPVEYLLWIDLETTGSDVEKDCIIEVGAILTTYNLDVIFEFESTAEPTDAGLGRLLKNKTVKNMHEKNGLLKDLLESDQPKIHEVTREILNRLETHEINPRAVALAGSGMGHFDKKFIDKYMPQLSNHCKYWVIDVGVLRRCYKMWTGHSASRANSKKTHRAIDDIRCHLQEARDFAEVFNTVLVE